VEKLWWIGNCSTRILRNCSTRIHYCKAKKPMHTHQGCYGKIATCICVSSCFTGASSRHVNNCNAASRMRVGMGPSLGTVVSPTAKAVPTEKGLLPASMGSVKCKIQGSRLTAKKGNFLTPQRPGWCADQAGMNQEKRMRKLSSLHANGGCCNALHNLEPSSNIP
jgi:hypothetical protein